MQMSQTSKDQVLVLHDGDLAETVRMLAPARRVRAFHRKARITLLCGEAFESLLKHCPYFDTVEPTLQAMAARNFLDRMKAARNSRYAVIYDLGAGSAAGKIKRAARFAGTRWVSAAPDPRLDAHPVDQSAATLAAAGLGGPAGLELGAGDPPLVDWIDFVAKQSRTLDPAYFGLQDRYCLLAPAGDDSPPPQRWPKERWASLAHELKAVGMEPVIVGGPSTRELGRYIAHVVPGARDLTGRANLIQLAGLGRRCSGSFGEDVPLLHLIVAAGAPAVLFHPGDTPPISRAPRGVSPTVLMHAPTLGQISAQEALQALRCAGGLEDRPQAA